MTPFKNLNRSDIDYITNTDIIKQQGSDRMYNVSLYKCDSYEYEKVKAILKKEIDELGGIKKFVSEGDRVIIKPNLVMKKAPSEAATTHPSLIRAMAELAAEAGGRAVIAESPGGPFNETLLKSIYKTCGMTEAAEKSGAELNYNTDTREVSFPEGNLLKKITAVDELLKADKIINVCKLKTHSMAKMTGAVKNMFGMIPGTMKAEYHLNRSNIADFANALIDICLLARPVLNITDAVECMEGNGPTGGNPRHVGLIMASEDPFALDIASAYILNISPKDIPVCAEAIKRGLSPENIDGITLMGDDIDLFVKKDFVVPDTKPINVTENLPKFLYRFINDVLQPYPTFDKGKCIGCGRCAQNCPPKALDMSSGHPELVKAKCIRCFCCQELCPTVAVNIKRPALYRVFSSL